MKDQIFIQNPYDMCVYIKGLDISNKVYLLIYTDDMLVASKDSKIVQSLNR